MRYILALLLALTPLSGQVVSYDSGGVITITPTITPTISSFSPDSVNGLQLWYKGDTFTQTEGAAISNWVNSASQSGWYLTNQTFAQWPQLTNNFNGTGNKALRFDGANHRLWISNSSALNITRNTNDCAIIAVLRQNASTLTKPVFAICTDVFANSREALFMTSTETTSAQRRNMDADSTVTVTGGTVIPTTISLCLYAEYVHTNKVAVSGSVMTIFTNNVQDATSTAGTHTNTLDTASFAIAMGTTPGGSFSFSGEIAEVLVYVPKPSADNRTAIYNYLKAKYSLVP